MEISLKPKARKQGVVTQEMPDEVLVYDLNNDKAHCLNKTAAFIWQSCNGDNSVTDIANLLEAEFGGKVSDDLVWFAIDQLNKDNLLEEKIQSKFSGISRRDVMKRLGLTAVVAMPVIASLAVPNNALAASSCVTGSTCTVPNPGDPDPCGGTCTCSGAMPGNTGSCSL